MENPQHLTRREIANALVVWVFRNGYLEDLHAGKHSELLENPELSRITDAEMKKLMIECCEKMERVLKLMEEDRDEFWRQVSFFSEHAKGWKKG